MNPRQAWLAEATEMLTKAGVPDAPRDARLLLRHVLGVRAEDLLDALRSVGTEDEQASFFDAVSRRADREPLSHITGERLFWGRTFKVNRHVLDPRPETEMLVDEALDRGPFHRVLDLGVGSGCLLLTLLAEWPEALGTGVDISADALSVARENAHALGLAGRADIIEGNWAQSVSGVFDLIVSNPPYLAEHEIRGIEPEVREHEPSMALVAGADGLDAYRIIASTVRAVLSDGGLLLLEIGPTQAEAVTVLLSASGWSVADPILDLDNRPRVIAATR